MRTVKIGRSSQNDIVLNNMRVSAQHAVICISDAGKVSIKDLNSTNGTYVNDVCIEKETPLAAGDRVRVGNSTVDWTRYLHGSQTRQAPATSYPGDVYAIKRRKTVGRLTDNDVVIDHSRVSSRHAQIVEKENGEIVIVDNGSTNGTYVNGLKITMHTLRPGDTVMIANKYPLRWEGIFAPVPSPVPSPKPGFGRTLVTTLVAAVAVAGLLLLAWNRRWIPDDLFDGKWSAEKVYSTYRKSVVMIEIAYCFKASLNGEFIGLYTISRTTGKPVPLGGEHKPLGGHGTGFFVSSDGKIVTNRHMTRPWEYGNGPEYLALIKDYVKLDIIAASLQKGNVAYLLAQTRINEVAVEGMMIDEYLGIYLNDSHMSAAAKIPCAVLEGRTSSSPEVDVAVIQTRSKTLPPGVDRIVDLSRAAVDDKEIVNGKLVYSIGFPAGPTIASTSKGLQANNQDGKITQDAGEIQFGHNISTTGGASGSPVFNEYGQLTGIHHAGYSAVITQGFNYAIKARYAVELLK
ncbi:MAG: FHA domain-containing protein [Tannerella sp.]|jgi:pSer/pThr/pTyr-binding forkhead associated (FHA) protein|nr:FHA domain-containing protein [Tannerella sp.]